MLLELAVVAGLELVGVLLALGEALLETAVQAVQAVQADLLSLPLSLSQLTI